jgi:DNA-binding CsgD family transcriptional regulator
MTKHKPRKYRRGSPLAPREVEFLRLVCQGYAIKQVSVIMGITRSTTSQFVTHIKRRTGARNLVQMGVWARDHGHAEPVSFKSKPLSVSAAIACQVHVEQLGP